VQIALRDGHITMGHARALINLDDDNQQLIILQQIIEDELNVRQVEALMRQLNKPPEKTVKSKAAKNVIPEKLRQEIHLLEDKLETKVSVKRSAAGKGSVVINFDSDETLNRLLRYFS
jgi:ParB family chromosome partitioning protein